MTTTAVEVMKAILGSPKDIDNVSNLTAPDVVYVSLNYGNPDRTCPHTASSHSNERIAPLNRDIKLLGVDAGPRRRTSGEPVQESLTVS